MRYVSLDLVAFKTRPPSCGIEINIARATACFMLPPPSVGFARASDRQRLERFVARTHRMGYLPTDVTTFADMVLSVEDDPLAAVSSKPSHVPSSVFPALVSRLPGLRHQAHDFSLSSKDVGT